MLLGISPELIIRLHRGLMEKSRLLAEATRLWEESALEKLSGATHTHTPHGPLRSPAIPKLAVGEEDWASLPDLPFRT